MYESILGLLRCPVCHDETLTYAGTRRDGRLVEGRLICESCERVYAVENEIPDLTDPKTRADEWEWEIDIAHFETFAAFDTAYTNSMPASVRENRLLFVHRLVQVADRSAGPILDLATGRGVLFRNLALLLTTDQPLIGMDIDKKVLRGLQRFLIHHGLYEPASLIAMDAKQLAFRPETLGVVTSWFGLNNMAEARPALRQVHQALMVGGLLAAAVLNVHPDSRSYAVAQEAGFATFLSQKDVETNLADAGFELEHFETIIADRWPGNPYDALPLRGDTFFHRLVIARKR